MLALFSNSFITAARMDGFSYVQGPTGNALLAEVPLPVAEQPKSALARTFAALRRTLVGFG